MSLHMNANMARLTVLGTGWSNTAIDSGNGFTTDGKLWNDVAGDLNYNFGDDVDWDLIADGDLDTNGSDIIYTDPDGNIYADLDDDGIWKDSLTGLEYPKNGEKWISEDELIAIANSLNNVVKEDSKFAQYNIPNDVIPSLFGGKVSTEITPVVIDSSRPHHYTPNVWYIQQYSRTGIIFLDEPFFHGTANDGSVTVYDEAITIRDGSSKAVYWSECTTRFTTNILSRPYNSYPIQYVCWQCLYGSLNDSLVAKKPDTITIEDIKNGNTGLPTMTYNGKTYYKIGGKD